MEGDAVRGADTLEKAGDKCKHEGELAARGGTGGRGDGRQRAGCSRSIPLYDIFFQGLY